jgi:hypothetical protein
VINFGKDLAALAVSVPAHCECAVPAQGAAPAVVPTNEFWLSGRRGSQL